MIDRTMRLSLNTLIAILFVVVVAMGFGLSYLSTSGDPMTVQVIEESDAVDLLPPTEDPSVAPSNILYEDAAQIPQEERVQIAERFLSPLQEYSAWVAGGSPVRSVLIRVSDASLGGQYIATVSYENGTIEDLTIARDASGVVWWRPACEAACVYTPEFAARYPQIVHGTMSTSAP